MKARIVPGSRGLQRPQALLDALHGGKQDFLGDGRLQDFPHAGAHRMDEELGRVVRAQHHDHRMRVLRAPVLEHRQALEVAAHAVQNDQVGALLISDYPRLSHSALVQRDRPRPIGVCE